MERTQSTKRLGMSIVTHASFGLRLDTNRCTEIP
jgi:hypothetical protein